MHREKRPLLQCQQMFWCQTSHAASPPWGQPEVGSTQQRILPGNLPWHCPTVQLQDIPRVTQGDPGGAGTGAGGERRGQAVDKALPMDFIEPLLQGRTTNQGWFLPRPAKLNPSKPAPQECEGCTVPGIFRPALALWREFQSIRLGELGELL